jgi:hypothetical protein
VVVVEQAESLLAKNAAVRVSRRFRSGLQGGCLMTFTPARLRVVRNSPGDLDLACGDVDDEEDVVPNQPGHRKDLDGEEIRCGDHTEYAFMKVAHDVLNLRIIPR